MKLKLTNIRIRPSLTTAWVSADDAGSALDTAGKLLSTTNALSDDGLTLTTIQIWASKQVYIDYISIDFVASVRAARAIYQADKLIGSSVVYEEIE
jgi:hypothetical protein